MLPVLIEPLPDLFCWPSHASTYLFFLLLHFAATCILWPYSLCLSLLFRRLYIHISSFFEQHLFSLRCSATSHAWHLIHMLSLSDVFLPHKNSILLLKLIHPCGSLL